MLNRIMILALSMLLSMGGWPITQMAHAQGTETNPTTSEKAIEQARLAFEEGRYAEAERLWRTVVEQKPTSAEAFYQLGFSLHRQEEIGAAIAAYREAIALKRDYDAPHMNLGLALIELMQFDEAALSFEHVLTLPDRPETPASTHTLANYNLAIIHKRQERPDLARQAVEAALTVTPDFAPAQTLRLQLQENQPEE